MVHTVDIKITKSATSSLADTDFSNLQFGKNFTDHMVVADYADGEWQGIEIVPYGDLQLSPANSALHYGQAFFEGLKAYKQVNGDISIFRPYKNAERFNKSAQRLCMPELPEDVFVQSIAALVNLEKDWIPAAPNHSLYIRPFMFATDAYLGVQPSLTYKFIVLAGPAGPYYSKSLKVKVETFYARSAEGGYGFAKAAGNYGGAMLPSKAALEEGFDQLIWTDAKEHAYVEEAGTANVMFVLDGKLITPSTRDTILKGITRDTVLKLVEDWDLEVEERRVSVAEIIAGAKNGTLTEAFGVGTAATITHIAEIGFEGSLYTLPDPAKRVISNKILKTLDQIRTGLISDPHNWNYMV